MPAGFPKGIPGIGEEIEGAMQHAPQEARQFIAQADSKTMLAYWVVSPVRIRPIARGTRFLKST